MCEQKTIAILRNWGLTAFADAVEATLEELASERWESRIFQMGSKGLLIVASRSRPFDIDGPDVSLDDPEWFEGGEEQEQDDLEPGTQEMLDKIIDLVSNGDPDMPLEGALDGMPSAVHGVTRMYPKRFLENAWVELLNHYQDQMIISDSDEIFEYTAVLAVVLNAMQEGLRQRIN